MTLQYSISFIRLLLLDAHYPGNEYVDLLLFISQHDILCHRVLFQHVYFRHAISLDQASIYIIFLKTRGTLLVLCGWRNATHCFVLFCFAWPKINHTHTRLWLCASLAEIRLHNILAKYIYSYMRNRWSCLFKINICWKIQKTEKTEQDKARIDEAVFQQNVPWFWKIL